MLPQHISSSNDQATAHQTQNAVHKADVASLSNAVEQLGRSIARHLPPFPHALIFSFTEHRML